MRARARVAFPGGDGTLDELFESLNLVQTRSSRPIPIVLVGADHWHRAVSFDYLVAEGFIEPQERALLRIAASGAEAAQMILNHYRAAPAAH